MSAKRDACILCGPRQGPQRRRHGRGYCRVRHSSRIWYRGVNLGREAFIAKHVQQRCGSTCVQVDKLVRLPLDPWTKWSVLHN